jgi:hypothetical protein
MGLRDCGPGRRSRAADNVGKVARRYWRAEAGGCGSEDSALADFRILIFDLRFLGSQ